MSLFSSGLLSGSSISVNFSSPSVGTPTGINAAPKSSLFSSDGSPLVNVSSSIGAIGAPISIKSSSSNSGSEGLAGTGVTIVLFKSSSWVFSTSKGLFNSSLLSKSSVFDNLPPCFTLFEFIIRL